METELLVNMFNAAKKDKKTFLAFKNLVVKTQQFELACTVREIEKELFPETEEEKQAKEIATKLNLAFRMVELNVTEPVCWLISETIKMYDKMGGNFSIAEASELIVKSKRLFDN